MQHAGHIGLYLAVTLILASTFVGCTAVSKQKHYVADADTPVVTLQPKLHYTRYGRMSDAELRNHLTLRMNQAQYEVFGEPATKLYETSAGKSGMGPFLWNGGGQPALAEAHLRTKRDPRFVIPLLHSKDVEVIMTGLWCLRWQYTDPRPADASLVQIMRQDLLAHRDVRVRLATLHTLTDLDRSLLRCIQAEDVDRALRDPALAVRNYALYQLLPEMTSRYNSSSADALDEGEAGLLVDALLFTLAQGESLERSFASSRLVEFADACQPPLDRSGVPKVDWLRASWRERDAAVEAWREVWAPRFPIQAQEAAAR